MKDTTMLQIQSPRIRGRRAVLKAGVLSMAGLNLATQQRLIAEGAAKKNNKSVILIWLDGGPSQLESYDPKPEAPGGVSRAVWHDQHQCAGNSVF